MPKNYIEPKVLSEYLKQIADDIRNSREPLLWIGLQNILQENIKKQFELNPWRGWSTWYAERYRRRRSLPFRPSRSYSNDGRIYRLSGALERAMTHESKNTITTVGDRDERVVVSKKRNRDAFIFNVNYTNPRSGANIFKVLQKRWNPVFDDKVWGTRPARPFFSRRTSAEIRLPITEEVSTWLRVIELRARQRILRMGRG